MTTIRNELATKLKENYIKSHSIAARALVELNDKGTSLLAFYGDSMLPLMERFDAFIIDCLEAEGLSDVEFAWADQAREDIDSTLYFVEDIEAQEPSENK